jgi:hypothetical protein
MPDRHHYEDNILISVTRKDLPFGVSGRRLFWLFVACVGFASGYHYTQQVWAIHSPVLVLILSIAAGGLGAIIAIFFQKKVYSRGNAILSKTN